MARPSSLTFFNEQSAQQLSATFTEEVVLRLRDLGAGVAMGLRDVSDERAAVIERLNSAAVRVHGWLLVSPSEGYFATHENPACVREAFHRFDAWVRHHRLSVPTVGLDFEPDLRELERLMAAPVPTFLRMAREPGRGLRLERALETYRALVDEIHRAGYQVEAYQFPMLTDDRAARSRFWQRTLGALDVHTDREVLMVYSSLLGPFGAGLVAHYARTTGAVAVGSTGGGVDPLPKLSWEAFSRDLRLATERARDLYVFSLEGCVQQGFLERLLAFSWDGRDALSWPQRAGATLTAGLIRGLARWAG